MQKKIQEKKWNDNPNPKAKIAFVIFYPFQFYVYKNIYKYFDDAEFIIDFGAFHPQKQPKELEEKLVIFLQEQGVYYRVLYYSDYYYRPYLDTFFEQYTTLVGVWERGCHFLDCNKNKKQVNLTYGAGKELTQVRFSRRYHDLILAFGSRDEKLFSLFTETKIVGNPKFDDWFNNDIDYKSVQKILPNISPDKKTILYLPTHSDLSSLDDLSDELESLTGAYNVIVKMHYFTIREEPEKVKKLSGGRIIVLQDDIDLLPLLKISNVVVSDNSSAIFDAMLADKPLVVTDFLSEDYINVQHKKERQYQRGRAGALTYSGSIEQVIKKDGLIITIQEPKEVEHAIEKALQDDIFYKQNRETIKNELFSFNDGKCGFRAAEEIKKISQTDHKIDRTILFHAIEANAIQIGSRSMLLNRDREQKLSEYTDILIGQSKEGLSSNELLFSVIVLDDYSEGVEHTLRSLYNQEFPVDDFEIVVVTINSKETIIEKLIHLETPGDKLANFINKITFINAESELLIGLGISEALSVTRGRNICFTRTGYIVPSDWLSDFSLAYRRFPSVAGVGGYAASLDTTPTALDEFFYIQITERLGIKKNELFFSRLYEIKNNLFYQNPAGVLCNMSYTKEVLQVLTYVFKEALVESLEIELKLLVTSKHDISFIPNRVYRINPLVLKDFIRENLIQGIAFCSLSYTYPHITANSRVTFIKSLQIFFSYLCINSGTMDHRFSLAFSGFIGYFFRWVGWIYWVLHMSTVRSNDKDSI